MQKQLPITTYGMDILRKVTKPVKEIDGEIFELVNNMLYTLRNADGIGLAAPQVNKNVSVAVIDISPVEEYKNYDPVILINPVVLENHGEVVLNEGCLSIPEVRGDVLRPEKILLKYFDMNMKEHTGEFEGLPARVMQHEIDHLNGKLFIDYLNEDDIKRNKDLLKKIRKGKIETDYPLYDPKENILN
ncbi:MAG: peptide deformylase [Ignavibacteria bacterium]|nr:peptide deformylase [Ignavibacteria bacterium]